MCERNKVLWIKSLGAATRTTNSTFQLCSEDEALKKKNIFVLTSTTKNKTTLHLIEKFPSYLKFFSAVAYLLGWIRRPKRLIVRSELTPEEFISSFLKTVQVVIHSEFAEEIHKLNKSTTTPFVNLHNLNPFWHEHSDISLRLTFIPSSKGLTFLTLACEFSHIWNLFVFCAKKLFLVIKKLLLYSCNMLQQSVRFCSPNGSF